MNKDDFSESFLIYIYVCIFVIFLIGLGLICVTKEEVVNNNEVKIEENINAEIENIQKEEVGKELQEIEKELQEKETNLEQQEIVEQNKEEKMMTLSEGHNELDSILADLGNVIVDVEHKDKFNKCLINLNYDNIVTLDSDKVDNTINELYSIIRIPSNTTEYDKLINRLDNFTENCPNFYEDDKLNHKYELINNIILKELR